MMWASVDSSWWTDQSYDPGIYLTSDIAGTRTVVQPDSRLLFSVVVVFAAVTRISCRLELLLGLAFVELASERD